MNFFSNQPFLYKVNAIKTLLFRCYNVCSNFANIHLEIKKLTQIFIQNSFPTQLVNNQVKKFLNNIFKKKETFSIVKKQKTVYIKMPYQGYISDLMKKEILEILTKCIPNLDFRLAFKAKKSNRLLLQHKG